jgi:RNA polymerase sigma-70 factor, ECF subfamily
MQRDNVTALLQAWTDGDDRALERLAPFVQSELRRIAGRYMAGERVGHTLQASALVNEAFLKLVDIRRIQWQNRAHFYAMSARLMRHVLVDCARSKKKQKRGGIRVTLDENLNVIADRTRDLVALDDALNALTAASPRVSQVVELRFFGGLTEEEIAAALHISTDTVLRDWKFAKVWLHRELTRVPSAG